MTERSLESITNLTEQCCMGELERGMPRLLLSPCAPPAWAAAVASVQHFGCSCWYRYVKLDSLCFGGVT